MRRNEKEGVAGAAAPVRVENDEPTNWAAAGEASISAAEYLDRLDPDLLRRRWRSVMGRPAPASLSRQLMIRILRWREQVARVGDLDSKTLATLATALANRSDAPSSAALSPRSPRPGAVLVREHGGVLHRVMVLDHGFAWSGRTFASLSSVARAVTGTNWNGRRFFGLDRTPQNAKDGRAAKEPNDRTKSNGRGRRLDGGSS
jgi:hypothetical protein